MMSDAASLAQEVLIFAGEVPPLPSPAFSRLVAS